MQVHDRFSNAIRLLMLIAVAPALLAQTGSSPFYDFRAENPGTVHKVTLSDLPGPGATKSAVNPPDIAERPAGAIPKTLPGFTVNLYADGFDVPRELRTAPNGDVFLAEMDKVE